MDTNLETDKFKLGLFVTISFLLLCILFLVFGLFDFVNTKVPVFTLFQESVQGLESGALVKYRGVPIGKVTDITLSTSNNLIRVDMEDAVYKTQKEKFRAVCDEVERNKYYAMIYSTVSWFQTKLASSQLDVFDRWIAQVGVNQPTFNKPYGMWQYTWNAQINGITGRVDENISYKDYPTIIRNAGLNHLEPEPEPPVSKIITVEQLKQMGYTSIQL